MALTLTSEGVRQKAFQIPRGLTLSAIAHGTSLINGVAAGEIPSSLGKTAAAFTWILIGGALHLIPNVDAGATADGNIASGLVLLGMKVGGNLTGKRE